MRFSRKAVLAELENLYPDARPELVFRNPYETLIAVMLAAQCTDRQVNKITPALFARYPDVAALAAADVAVKSADVEIGFLDRFCGTLILLGDLVSVQTAVEEVVRFFSENLGFRTCAIHRS